MLYSAAFIVALFGWFNSIRMIVLILVPIIPAKILKIIYIVPISLWFVEYIHRFINKIFFSSKENFFIFL